MSFLAHVSGRWLRHCLSALLWVICSSLFISTTAAAQIKTIGIASFGPHPAMDAGISGFKQELASLGFIAGQNVRYVEADAAFTPALIPSMLARIEAARPDVILTVTTPVSQAAITSVKNKALPLVFLFISDPIAAGLVPDWQTGGARFTGSASAMNYPSVMQFAKRMFPQANSLGVLYAPGEANDVVAMRQVEQAAKEAGYLLKAVSVDAAVDVQQRSQLLSSVDFVYAIGSNLVQSAMPAVASVTDRYGIPILSAETEFIKQGVAAVSYAASYPLQGAQAARAAAQILNGKRTAEIPPVKPGPADYYTLISRKKLAQLGVPIPAAFANCNCFVD